MNFLVDECTGPAVARWLRDAGHDAVSVTECMSGSDDELVIERAARERRVLVTNDKDFGELVFKKSKQHSGVIVLRLQDESPSAKIAAIAHVLESYGEQLSLGFFSVTETRIRRSK